MLVAIWFRRVAISDYTLKDFAECHSRPHNLTASSNLQRFRTAPGTETQRKPQAQKAKKNTKDHEVKSTIRFFPEYFFVPVVVAAVAFVFLCASVVKNLPTGDNTSMRILLSGSSGLVGTELLPSLTVAQYEVSRLVRTKAGKNDVQWDPERPLLPNLVDGFDAVIHLAGENIAGRWTPEKKAQIRNSRVQGTRTLVEALMNAVRKPRVFICASAIGY